MAVGRLHHLAAGSVAGINQMAGLVFIRPAHVKDQQGMGFLFPAPFLQGRAIDHRNPVMGGHDAGPVAGQDSVRGRHRRGGPVLAVVQFEPRQMPAHGAVAQGHHRVRHAGVAQGLGPQDAARATGAVDHHRGFRIGRQGGDTVG